MALMSLMIAVVLLSVIGMVSQAVNLRQSFRYEPYEEITENLSSSFRSALASALANMTVYLNGSTDPHAVEKARLDVYRYLTKWKDAAMRAYSEIGLRVDFTTPLSSASAYQLQGPRNMSFQTGPNQYYYDYIPAWNLYNLTQVHWDQSMGCSAAYATLYIDIPEYGFYGWKKDIIVAANATIYPDTFKSESGRAPADIVLVLDASGSMFYNGQGAADKDDNILHITGTLGRCGWTTVGITNFGDIPTQFHSVLTWSVLSGSPTIGFQMKNGSFKPQLEVSFTNATGSFTKPLPATADAYVRGSQPNTNYGSAGSLQVQSDQGGNVYRTWLRFDLSSISSGSPISAATLSVYVTSSSRAAGRTYYAHHSAVDTWGEGSITWNNQPSFGTSYSETYAPSNKGWMSWDVTSYVQQDFDEDKKTSWVIMDSDESSFPTSYVVVNSKEATVGDKPGVNLLRSYKYSGQNRRDVWSMDVSSSPSNYENTLLNAQGSDFGRSNMWYYGKDGEWLLQLNNTGTGSIRYTLDVYTRKLDQVRNAATMFLEMLNPSLDRIAIVEYGPHSNLVGGRRQYIAFRMDSSPGHPFFNLSVPSQFNAAFNNINWRNNMGSQPDDVGYGFKLWSGYPNNMYGVWGGATPTGAGIDVGANIFNSTNGARSEAKKIMIILSDGKENIKPLGSPPDGQYYEPYTVGDPNYHHYYSIDNDLTGDAYNANGVITYAIGYGDDADAYALNILAQNGHGEYYYAANGTDLARILADLAYKLNDELSFHFTLTGELMTSINTLSGSQLTVYLVDAFGYRHKADLSRFVYQGGGNFDVTLAMAGWQTPQAMEMVVRDPRGILVRLHLDLSAWRTQGG